MACENEEPELNNLKSIKIPNTNLNLKDLYNIERRYQIYFMCSVDLKDFFHELMNIRTSETLLIKKDRSDLEKSFKSENVSKEKEKDNKSVNTNFVGINTLLKEQKNQLDLFEKWAKKKSWNEMHTNHYDWWSFPINMGSASKGDSYKLTANDVKKLSVNADFIKNLRRSAELVLLGFGWDIKQNNFVSNKSKDQTWTNNVPRLYKIGRSLLLFRQLDYYQSVESMAKALKNKSVKLIYGAYGADILDMWNRDKADDNKSNQLEKTILPFDEDKQYKISKLLETYMKRIINKLVPNEHKEIYDIYVGQQSNLMIFLVDHDLYSYLADPFGTVKLYIDIRKLKGSPSDEKFRKKIADLMIKEFVCLDEKQPKIDKKMSVEPVNKEPLDTKHVKPASSKKESVDVKKSPEKEKTKISGHEFDKEIKKINDIYKKQLENDLKEIDIEFKGYPLVIKEQKTELIKLTEILKNKEMDKLFIKHFSGGRKNKN